jgi:predicted transcriptional regulator
MTIKQLDMSGRRDKIVIMAEIMGIAKRGALKTQIMYKANLSFNQLNQYLRLLISTKLLAKTNCDGKDVYRVTQKGEDFLMRHEELMCLISDDISTLCRLRFQ